MPTRTVHRQCTLCEAHCGVSVEADGGRVTSIVGDPEDVLSGGYLCPKGVALADLHHDPDRLRRPLRRVGDGWEEIGWDDALEVAASRLRRIQRESGRDAVGLYFGNPSAHAHSAIWVELFRRMLRSRNVFSATSVDQLPQYLTSYAMFGQHILLPVADIDRTDHLLVIGANPAVSNGSITTMPDARGRIRAVRRRGGQVTVVDPRRTETARLADRHLAVRPGGDPYLLLGLLATVFDEGLETTRDLPVSGVTDVRRLASGWPAERAADPAGIESGAIRSLARDFASAPSAVAYARIGVCHHQTGAITHWLVNVLNAVTGNLDRPGGAMFTTPPVDLQMVVRLLSGPTHRDRYRSRVRGLPEFQGELPVVTMPEEILTPGPGRIRGLIVHAGNPALSSPDGARVTEALESLDTLVSIDPYITETSRHAEVILPPVSPLERSEFDAVFPFFSVRNNARYSHAVFPKPEDGREDWEILASLGARLLDGPVSGRLRGVVEAVTHQLGPERLIAAGIAVGPHGILRKGWRRGLTLGRVKRSRGGIDLGPLEPRLPGVLRTADRRVHLAPELLLEEARRLGDGNATDVEHDQRFDLVLIGRRQLRSNNSWMHNSPRLVKGRDRCTALLHPDEADRRGLVDGQQVRVVSAIGAVEVPIEISDELRPGVVSIPHGWGHDEKEVGWSTARAHPGANVNRITDGRLIDRLSGNAALNATRVRLEPA